MHIIAARYEIELRIVFWMGRDCDKTTSPVQFDCCGAVLVTRWGTFVVTPPTPVFIPSGRIERCGIMQTFWEERGTNSLSTKQ
jgi:hypothetical protein